MAREDMRAGDSDRQAVAERLKSALDEGRLDLHEYDDRLQRAYASKTFGELEPLVADLPATTPAERSRLAPQQPATPAVAPIEGEMRPPSGPPWLASYGGVVLVCVVIWAISCVASRQFIYPWPAWMLIPLIFAVLRRSRGRGR